MKRFLTFICVLVISSSVLIAQDVTSTKDTLVLVVKQDASDSFFETLGDPFRKAYKAVEDAVVRGYKAMENAVVKGYKAVENAFVEPFTNTKSND